MRYLKNFGLLLIVTSTLAACQIDDSENSSDAVSKETNVAASNEETNANADTDKEQPAEADTPDDEPGEIEDVDESGIEDEKLTDIVVETEEVESYKAELNMSAAMDNMEPRELNAEVLYIKSDPPQLLLRSFNEDHMISKEGKIYYNNGASWIDISDSVDTNLLYNVTYDEAVASFAEIAPHMEQEEQEDEIIYTYSGDNDNVYKTIESLVQVNFGEMQVESVNSTVEVIANEDNNLIEEIKFEADGTDTEGTFELDGTVSFTEFNEVDEIEFPEME